MRLLAILMLSAFAAPASAQGRAQCPEKCVHLPSREDCATLTEDSEAELFCKATPGATDACACCADPRLVARASSRFSSGRCVALACDASDREACEARPGCAWREAACVEVACPAWSDRGACEAKGCVWGAGACKECPQGTRPGLVLEAPGVLAQRCVFDCSAEPSRCATRDQYLGPPGTYERRVVGALAYTGSETTWLQRPACKLEFHLDWCPAREPGGGPGFGCSEPGEEVAPCPCGPGLATVESCGACTTREACEACGPTFVFSPWAEPSCFRCESPDLAVLDRLPEAVADPARHGRVCVGRGFPIEPECALRWAPHPDDVTAAATRAMGYATDGSAEGFNQPLARRTGTVFLKNGRWNRFCFCRARHETAGGSFPTFETYDGQSNQTCCSRVQGKCLVDDRPR